MERNIECPVCKIIFICKEWGNRIGNTQTCSMKCQAINRTFWEKATPEEKIARLKKLFEKKVIKKNGCWDWVGKLLSGRGKLCYGRKAIQAHRVSWMINFGEIPKGKYVCHSCDNPICTNPKHLFLGTPSENTIDMVKKGRRPHGKLKINDVIKIKELLANNIPGTKIAEQFSVHPVTISEIKLKKTWYYV